MIKNGKRLWAAIGGLAALSTLVSWGVSYVIAPQVLREADERARVMVRDQEAREILHYQELLTEIRTLRSDIMRELRK